MDNFVRRQDMKRRRLASDTVDSDSEEEANKEMIEEPAAEDQLFAKDQLIYEKSIEKQDLQNERSLKNKLQAQLDQLKEENAEI